MKKILIASPTQKLIVAPTQKKIATLDKPHTFEYPPAQALICKTTMDNVIPHPTSGHQRIDREKARENLARQLRTNQMMRESARERINASQIIDDIGTIEAQLMGSYTEATKEIVDKATGEITLVQTQVAIPLEREVISALKARADIKFRLLGKVLPDLKATESISHNVHDHSHTIHSPVSSVEMATRIQLWQKQVRSQKQDVKVINEIEQQPVPQRPALLTPPPESVVNDSFEEYDWL